MKHMGYRHTYHRIICRLCVPVLASAALCAVTPAFAQDGAANKAAAEALYQQGQELMAQAKYEEACDKFRSSQQMDAGLGTLLYLADCYEKLGRTASAWATFEEASSIAASRGEATRYEIARGRASSLKPLLSYIVIRSAEPLPKGAVVKRDGSILPESLWGVPIPNDPGDVVINVEADGYASKNVKVVVGKAVPTPVEVMLPALERLPPTEPAAVEPASPEPAKVTVSAADVTTREPDSNLETWGLVVGGVGVAALGVSLLLTIMGNADHEDSLANCSDLDENACGPTGVKLRKDALSKLGIATGFGIGGAVALGGGILLYVAAPTQESATPTAAGLGYRGVW